ncbi:MAG: hypothetical protein KBF30_09970 [Hyphomonadaceae bacterium]|nr:hypothetical protein [Hyphomonadaceae bacterium]
MSAGKYEAEEIIGAVDQLYSHLAESRRLLFELLPARPDETVRELADMVVSAMDMLADLLGSLRRRSIQGQTLSLYRHELAVAESGMLVSESILRYLAISADQEEAEPVLH